MNATAQPLNALAKANQIRSERAELKRELKTLGTYETRRRVADLVEDPPDYIRSMRIGKLLAACRRLGILRARTLFLRPLQISEHRVVGDLTDREAASLAERLRTGHRASHELAAVERDARRAA